MVYQLRAWEEQANDVLRVVGFYGDEVDEERADGSHYTAYYGNEVAAYGWISATTNYYGPETLDDDGLRIAGSQPRAMDNAERFAYAKQLVDAAYENEYGPVPIT